MSSDAPADGVAGAPGGPAALARGAARWALRLPERLLHPVRRGRARDRLRDARLSGPVLFVCQGNICRSPYAEERFRILARGRFEAASAGLTGPDRPSPETARAVSAERDVDLTGHRSRLVSHPMLGEAGLVVVMEPAQARVLARRFGHAGALVLGDLDPKPVRRRPIRDPIFQPPEVFREVYDRIDRCVEGLADALGLPVPGPQR